MKKMSAFRLSPEALFALDEAAKRTGLEKTKIVEWCLLRASGQIPDSVRVGMEAVDSALSSVEELAMRSGAAALKVAGVPMPPLKSTTASPIDNKPAPSSGVHGAKGAQQSPQAQVPSKRARRSAA